MRSNHSDLRGRRASGGEGERVIAGMVDSVLAEVAERLLRDAQASHSGPMFRSSNCQVREFGSRLAGSL
jgi:hypothetical protein